MHSSLLSRVGIIAPFSQSQWHWDWSTQQAISAIQQELMNKQLSFHSCRWRPDPAKPWREVPPETLVSGMNAILSMGVFDFYYLARLAQSGLPMVAYDVDATTLGIDSAFFDDHQAAFQLTKTLLDRGHRRIVYVGGPQRYPFGKEIESYYYDPVATERAKGYCLAMRTLAPELGVHVFFISLKSSAEEAFGAVPDCSAIVCDGILDAGKLRGGVETAGFWAKGDPENVKRAGLVAVAECDFVKLAQAASRLLLARIAEPFKPACWSETQPEIRSL
jgi:DNA-binding LacI/PurR family transcriptional regulator